LLAQWRRATEKKEIEMSQTFQVNLAGRVAAAGYSIEAVEAMVEKANREVELAVRPDEFSFADLTQAEISARCDVARHIAGAVQVALAAYLEEASLPPGADIALD
jgi:hypothetical protein